MKMRSFFFVALFLIFVIASSVVASAENTSFWINVTPISDKHFGDTFNITATTNLPEGTGILVQVYNSRHCPKNGCNDPFFRGATGEIPVINGESGTNATSFFIDTSSLAPAHYFVTESAIKENATGTTMFEVFDTSDKRYWIALDPIGEQYPEGTMDIVGETNLAVGDDVAVRIFNGDIGGLYSQNFVTVTSGESIGNETHYSINLTDLVPANYTVYEIGGPKFVFGNTTFHVSPIKTSAVIKLTKAFPGLESIKNISRVWVVPHYHGS